MSVTESKAKATVKTSKKTVNPAEAAALKAALEAAQVEMVPLSALVKSPLNVRTIPYPADSVREMADSIMAIGLIQNLVVHSLPDGMSGVAAGGRRLAALQQLLSEQRIDAGYPVVVKRVSDDLAMVASMVENNQRVAMHPAEQISGFRTLSEEGKTPAKIGDLLGYSARHVQRMLKLANLAPELITLLAEDKLDVEQCQALSLESDPARQVQVYDQVKTSYGSTPAHLLKRAITDTEIAVTHSRFVFIGREAYEAAGGVVREDLFSAQEGDGTADGVLVERLVQEKLAAAALAIEQQEGWSWSLAREGSVRNYGDDREHYLVLPAPEGEFSAEELQRLDELYATLEATETFEDEATIQVLIDEIENAASVRAWTPEQKAACGVVVSLYDGELCVQRGVQKKIQTAVSDVGEHGGDQIINEDDTVNHPGGDRGGSTVKTKHLSGGDVAGGIDEHRADQQQQHAQEDVIDGKDTLVGVSADHVRHLGAAVAEADHTGEIVVHSSADYVADGDGDECDGPEQDALNGSDDGAGACDIQQVDEAVLPSPHGNVVHAVLLGISGRLPVIGAEDLFAELAIDGCAYEQDHEADQESCHKNTHSFSLTRGQVLDLDTRASGYKHSRFLAA